MPAELNIGGGKGLGDQNQHTSEVLMRAKSIFHKQ